MTDRTILMLITIVCIIQFFQILLLQEKYNNLRTLIERNEYYIKNHMLGNYTKR